MHDVLTITRHRHHGTALSHLPRS